MGEITHISWCEHTWNPWIGCQKVGPACDHCYAQAEQEHRYHRVQFGEPGTDHPIGTRHRTKTWREPFKWDRAAADAGERRFVFCASLADIFDNHVPPEWRAEAFEVMRQTPHLVYLLLTKRPQMIQKLAKAAGGLPANCALMCTVVTQEEADRDLPHLLIAGAALQPLFLGVSIEPPPCSATGRCRRRRAGPATSRSARRTRRRQRPTRISVRRTPQRGRTGSTRGPGDDGLRRRRAGRRVA